MTITVYPQTTFEIIIQAPKDIKLTVKDKETNSLVKNVRVSLEDISGKSVLTDTTTQEGTVIAKDILSGEYRVGVHIFDDGGESVVYSQYKQLTSDAEIIEVDMLNPKLFVSGTTRAVDLSFAQECKITISNSNEPGSFISKNAIAVCQVYSLDLINPEKQPEFIGSQAVTFRNIAPGGFETETVKISRTPNPLTKEEIVIVVYDSNPYGPNKETDLSVSTSADFASRVITDAYRYCSTQPVKCVKLGGQFVGETLKTFFGSKT